jgi:hypothetical protein
MRVCAIAFQASQSKSWDTSDLKDLSGKVLLVTGANAGIGLEVSKELARRSGIVHMLCRYVSWYVSLRVSHE